MKLKEDGSNIFIVGQINKKELNFMANYLVGFGKNIVILEPRELKKEYIALLEQVLHKNKLFD